MLRIYSFNIGVHLLVHLLNYYIIIQVYNNSSIFLILVKAINFIPCKGYWSKKGTITSFIVLRLLILI
jgi:hypothetical protein